MCTLTSSKRRNTSLGKKLKAYNLVISGWVKPRTTGAEAQFWLRQPWRNLPLFFSPSSIWLLSLPFLTRVWEYDHGKIVELKMFVVRFKAFWRFIALITFPWNKKVNSPPHFLIFVSPEDFRDAFCVNGGAFGRPWLRWIRRLTRRTQDFIMEGVHVVGHGQGSGDV